MLHSATRGGRQFSKEPRSADPSTNLLIHARPCGNQDNLSHRVEAALAARNEGSTSFFGGSDLDRLAASTSAFGDY